MRILVLAAASVTFLAAVRGEKLTSRVPMRDGVHLAANVFKPTGDGKFPVLLVRTPYNKGNRLYPGWHIFLENGFAVVIQDVRGRYESEGFFRPLEQEVNDGYDTISWAAAQPWSNGKVGMLGGSYLGIVQWKAALSRHPALRAISPVVAGYDDYRDRFYSRGGAMKLGHRLLWMAENVRAPGFVRTPFVLFTRHLPLRSADRAATGRSVAFWQQALDHPIYDSFWKSISTKERIHRIGVPVFLISGWYDNFAQSDLEAFAALRRNSEDHRIVVGPWAHDISAKFREVNFGSGAMAPLRTYQLAWFRHWLGGAGELTAPPVRLFVMGVNRWRDEQEWPLRRTVYTPYYLSSGAGARSAAGDGVLLRKPRRDGGDEYVYDPERPVPTQGGAVCCNPKQFPWGPMDQRRVESRQDVLVYSTAPLKRSLEVTGPVRGILYVSTSARDTDFTVKLVDVDPDGFARNLCDGILRLRYRNGLDRSDLAAPGEIYQVTINAGVTSNVFLPGHRIRVEISSSNFPRFDRNLNTGRAIADDREFRIAKQKVWHGRAHASHVLLPVIN